MSIIWNNPSTKPIIDRGGQSRYLWGIPHNGLGDSIELSQGYYVYTSLTEYKEDNPSALRMLLCGATRVHKIKVGSH